MSGTPALIFSHFFSGTIWNTLAIEKENFLFIEVRDGVNFQVKFSMLDYGKNEFIWKDVSLPESWWLGLTAADNNTLLLHRYLTKGNPDDKSLIAFDVATKTIRWEVEAFSFFDWDKTSVIGYRTKVDLIQVRIDLASGNVTEENWEAFERFPEVETERPIFYAEGTAHFETVKKFIRQADYNLTKGVEYLEFNDWIIVSVYTDDSGNLANYLLVYDRTGSLELAVKLGEKLTGLGADTFFILSGCLFLVKNKTELVAYRL